MYFNGPATGSDSDKGWSWQDSFSVVGDNGEIVSVRMNEARNLITHMANLACATPPALRAVAKDSTPDATQDAQIADSVLREDFDPVAGGQLVRECVEFALAVTGAFLDPEWDALAGEAYVPSDDGGMYYSGKPKVSLRMVDEVCFDLTKRKWTDVDDCVILQRANRFMLASQFKDLEEKILSVPSLSESEFAPFQYDDEDTNDIILFRYIHKAGNRQFLPQGRLALVLEDGTVLRDGSSPYALVDPTKIGLFPIMAGAGLNTVYGYATMNDLSPLTQWQNLMATMAATLVVGYGAPNLSGPPMASMQVQDMVGGGRYFGTPGGGEVKPMNLLDAGSLKQLVELMQFVMGVEEKHAGMNSVIRGESSAGDSGVKVALFKSMAVQFMSGLQQNIIATVQGMGNYLIRMREKLSTADEVADLSSEADGGGAHRSVPYKASKTFGQVARVRAEAVDPMSQTPEGREMRADKMLDKGAFPPGPTTSRRYLAMVRTGRDEPMYKAEMATFTLIGRENEKLRQGILPKMLMDDEHEIHIPEHLADLADPDIRENDDIVQQYLEHVAEHKMGAMGIAVMRGDDPMTGQPYPPAAEQFKQAEVQQQQQAAMQQGGAPNAPANPGQGQAGGSPANAGPPPSSAPSGGGGAPAPVTASQAMQQAAMGPPTS